ncbi:hypothetical protein AC249_AIPGENE17596 [Exaiptasia diaphana]|nr:hypothetical protein AC249_AIPGENE17596 [Exaiptasia diaphana]
MIMFIPLALHLVAALVFLELPVLPEPEAPLVRLDPPVVAAVVVPMPLEHLGLAHLVEIEIPLLSFCIGFTDSN